MLHRPWASGRSRGGPCHFSPVSAVMDRPLSALDGTVFKDSRSVDTEPFVGTGLRRLRRATWGSCSAFSQSFSTDAFETKRRPSSAPECVLVFLTSSTTLMKNFWKETRHDPHDESRRRPPFRETTRDRGSARS